MSVKTTIVEVDKIVPFGSLDAGEVIISHSYVSSYCGGNEMKIRLEQTIALRAAKEFRDGAVVNLGYGMPGLCANFIPEGRAIFPQSENAVLGYGQLASDEKKDYEFINACDQPVNRQLGMCYFDTAIPFTNKFISN